MSYEENLAKARRIIREDMNGLNMVIVSIHNQLISRQPLQDDEDDALLQAGYHIVKAKDELHRALMALEEGV